MKKHGHIPDGFWEAICKLFQNGVKVFGIARNLSTVIIMKIRDVSQKILVNASLIAFKIG